MVTAEQDDTGLWYVSDGAVFVAAPSAGGALELAAMARARCPVPGHAWFNHDASGSRVCVPLPEWQTEAQRCATIVRLLQHLADLDADGASLPDTPPPVPRSLQRRRPGGGRA